MLTLHHRKNEYPPPLFRTRSVELSARLPGAVALAVDRGAFTQPFQKPSSASWSDGDLNEVSLDEFNERYLVIRDELALRALRSEPLTERDRVRLEQLNEALDRLLPKPVRSVQTGLAPRRV